MKGLGLILLLSAFFISHPLFAKLNYEIQGRKLETTCYKIPKSVSQNKAKYCLTSQKNSRNKDLLYHFHGIFGSHYSWPLRQRHHGIMREWIKNDVDFPTVVTLSFGRVWLLNTANGAHKDNLINEVVFDVIPYIENKHFPDFNQRLVLGDSMGSFNLLQLSLRYHDLFARAAAMCPALSQVHPFDDADTQKTYVERTGASWPFVLLALKVSKSFFPYAGTWLSDTPLEIAEDSLEGHPPLYLSYNLKDQYGFWEGGKEFVRLAALKGVEIVSEALDETHCKANSKSVANFLYPTL